LKKITIHKNTEHMTSTTQRFRIGILLSALSFMLPFQSCTKEEAVEPLAAPGISDAVTSVPPPGAVPAACKEVCLVAGQHTYMGTVGAAMQDGNLLVTYNVTKANVFLSEVHLDVFSSLEQLKGAHKLSNGGAIPGKFAFKQSWKSTDHVTTYTATIPKAYVDQIGTDCFFVAAHAALSNGETAWGGLCTDAGSTVSLNSANQFPGNNWGVYFEFCKSSCNSIIDFTYAWEDVNGSKNDADYNDMVVQSDVIKSANELKIKFLATARGASFDHKFKIKIPKAGVTGIFGAPSYTQDDTYYYITVFESTKAALPGSATGFANTRNGQCTPYASKDIVLAINSSFAYNSTRPYEPYISVYTSGNASVGKAYDLYLYEVSHRDTWTAADGKVYPNGILIPSDWRWPLEGVSITRPYPNFTSLSQGFTPNWATPLAVPTLTYDKSSCH
jgi:LruC domain-containing protein